MHKSTKPQSTKKTIADLDQTSFKDSERKAPEAVQSVKCRPQKKARTSAALHTHTITHHPHSTDNQNRPQQSDIRSNNLIERIRRRLAGRNADPCGEGQQSAMPESRSEPTDDRKSKAARDEQESTSKKVKIGEQVQRKPEAHTVTRKRMREELEERIGNQRMQRASFDEQESKRIVAMRAEAVFETKPQLPGRKGGAERILERLKGRSEKLEDENSREPWRINKVHERGAITRLLSRGGDSSKN